MGAFEGQKRPVQDVRPGDRPLGTRTGMGQGTGRLSSGQSSGYPQSGGYGEGSEHVQESGIHVPREQEHSPDGKETNDFPPPSYEPRQ